MRLLIYFFNSYFGILSKIYRLFTWTQLLQREAGEGQVPPQRCQIGIFRGPNKWRYEEEMVGHVAVRCFNERNKKRFLIFGIPRQRMSKWIANRSKLFFYSEFQLVCSVLDTVVLAV
jgi:hypothetical protein